jgi:hypothetical protein
MNALLEKIIKNRNGHYCHAFEGNLDDFKNLIDCLIDEFNKEFPIETIIDFIQSMEIYYLDDDYDDTESESELYNFSIKDYINENYFF